MGGLELVVPSLVGIGAAVLVLVGVVVGLRRVGTRREAIERSSVRALETQAKSRLVRADEAVRDAEQEVRFAEVQFGPETAREVAEAVDRARGWLREAFLLQQRLDEAPEESSARRRSWNDRIGSLCDSIEHTLAEADQRLAGRRAAEREAVRDLPALRERLQRSGARRADAAELLARLGTRFDAASLAGGQGATARADRSIAAAQSAVQAAEAHLGDAAHPLAPELQRAWHALDLADRELAAVERIELDLTTAAHEAEAEAAALAAELAAARAERDVATDAEGAAALARAIGDCSPLLVGREAHAGDPFAERDRLRAARDRLEVARSATRRAEGRLDGARGALPGAIAIAESQVAVARSAMERARAFVGADARTRLAEAERQLGIARRESDPVAALDAARRAAARASDAEALAHYAALHR
ncbi:MULTISPECIES: hypothetical protein [unclassified Agromyces]|uniref:hypothetical protein n=1 Tax=unclassified Agromyces TaxID=2639701 RepID=UPI00301560B5